MPKQIIALKSNALSNLVKSLIVEAVTQSSIVILADTAVSGAFGNQLDRLGAIAEGYD